MGGPSEGLLDEGGEQRDEGEGGGSEVRERGIWNKLQRKCRIDSIPMLKS